MEGGYFGGGMEGARSQGEWWGGGGVCEQHKGSCQIRCKNEMRFLRSGHWPGAANGFVG